MKEIFNLNSDIKVWNPIFHRYLRLIVFYSENTILISGLKLGNVFLKEFFKKENGEFRTIDFDVEPLGWTNEFNFEEDEGLVFGNLRWIPSDESLDYETFLKENEVVNLKDFFNQDKQIIVIERNPYDRFISGIFENILQSYRNQNINMIDEDFILLCKEKSSLNLFSEYIQKNYTTLVKDLHIRPYFYGLERFLNSIKKQDNIKLLELNQLNDNLKYLVENSYKKVDLTQLYHSNKEIYKLWIIENNEDYIDLLDKFIHLLVIEYDSYINIKNSYDYFRQ